ncbi:aminotransferase class IV family protein [Mesorhizobium sp. CAU 1741]|uniref:aminotransferase class IV family protein n=1 Tax=Mesorhizobium sp. CAU 1741 TaxID=3140366 RepID=UPI00325B54A7
MPAQGALRDGRETGFHLIETMRWEPGAGIKRADLHMARLAASAAAFEISFDPAAIRSHLAALEADAPLRVRIALDRDGATVETWPFLPLDKGAIWKLKVASRRLDSADPFLRHKTSRRAAYEAARAEFPATEADEVLLLNEKDEVCEGTITTLFVKWAEGPFVTPPLSCGLLAGVLREQLLADGDAVEAVVRLEGIEAASGIFVGNSLRGLIPATLA